MKPQYFDLTVDNLTAAREFFANVLDWKFERFPIPYEYYRIKAGAEDEPGIDGGIGAVKDTAISGGRPLVNLTVNVPSIDDCIAKVKKNGGSLVEPRTAIPGIGWYATCAEPGGLLFGILEGDTAVR